MNLSSLASVGGADLLLAGIGGASGGGALPGMNDFGPASVVELSEAAIASSAILTQSYVPSAAALPYEAQVRQNLARQRDIIAADTALLTKDYAGVREVARRMMQRDRSDSAAPHLIARSYQAQGDLEQAAEWFQRAVELEPDNGRFGSDLQNARILQKPESTAVKAAIGMLHDPGQRAAGLRLVAALADRTQSAATLVALGDAFAEIKAKQQALGAYALALEKAGPQELDPLLTRAQQLLSDEPDAAVAHDFVGKVLVKMGRFDAAIGEFARARTIDGAEAQYTIDLADAYAARADARLESSDLAGAKDDYEQARLLRPTFARFKRGVAVAGMELGRQWLERGALKYAFGELNAASLALPSDDVELKRRLSNYYYTLGNRYAAAGELGTAVSAFQHSYDLNGSLNHKNALAEGRNAFGLEFLGNEQWEDAVEQFELAVELFPNNDEYAANLAEAQSHIT